MSAYPVVAVCAVSAAFLLFITAALRNKGDGSFCSTRNKGDDRGCRPFSTENEHTGSFSGRSEPHLVFACGECPTGASLPLRNLNRRRESRGDASILCSFRLTRSPRFHLRWTAHRAATRIAPPPGEQKKPDRKIRLNYFGPFIYVSLYSVYL